MKTNNKNILLISIVLGCYISSIVFFSIFLSSITLFCVGLIPLMVILVILSIYQILIDLFTNNCVNEKYYKNNNDLCNNLLQNEHCIQYNKREVVKNNLQKKNYKKTK